ncbi:hypothetical protein PVAG01_10693 [Phlyctema vagabunda]|uniref:Uncharacterized protein n=1 Tax=Phlyctema vagabunda TaxID=108571 RepID=A0ABR4P307_9HELO
MCEQKVTVFTECGHKKTHNVHLCSAERNRLRSCCWFLAPSQLEECEEPERVNEQRSILCRQCRDGTRSNGSSGSSSTRRGDKRHKVRVHRDSTGDARTAARNAMDSYGFGHGVQIPEAAHQVPGINLQEWENYQSNRGYYSQQRRGDNDRLGREIDDAIEYTNAWGAGGYF